MCNCFQCNMTEEEFDAGFENYIERERLIKKARSFHVPGHGPNFENMTNEQIENHIKFIGKTFEMAFSKDENKLFEECQRHISRNSGDDNKATE